MNTAQKESTKIDLKVKTNEFLDWVRGGNQMQDWPALCHDKPSLDHSNIILCSKEAIAPESKRSSLEMAPCSICSPKMPKFFSGYLIFATDTEKFHIIGKDCGKKHFGVENWAIIERNFDDKNGEEYLLNLFVSDNIEYYHNKVDILDNIYKEIYKIKSKLYNGITEKTAKIIFKNAINDNMIKIHRELTTNTGQKFFEVYKSFPLSGLQFLSKKPKNYWEKIWVAKEMLDKLKIVKQNDKVEDLIKYYLEENLIRSESKKIRENFVIIDEICEIIYDFIIFSKTDNVNNLIKWANEKENTINIKINRTIYGQLKIDKKIYQTNISKEFEDQVNHLFTLNRK